MASRRRWGGKYSHQGFTFGGAAHRTIIIWHSSRAHVPLIYFPTRDARASWCEHESIALSDGVAVKARKSRNQPPYGGDDSAEISGKQVEILPCASHLTLPSHSPKHAGLTLSASAPCVRPCRRGHRAQGRTHHQPAATVVRFALCGCRALC